MATIYRDAAAVCIWLGREADDSALALKFVRQVLNLEYFDRLVHDPRHKREWLALSTLMRRAWFSRRWVIQEITFAKQATLHCGKDWVKWKEFAHVVGLIGVRHHDIRQLFIESSVLNRNSDYPQNITSLAASRLIHTARNLFHKSDEGEILAPILPLETLVYSLVPFETTRLHDIIYAILPLASDIRYPARPTVDEDIQEPEGGWRVLSDKEKDLARGVVAKLAFLRKDATYPIDYDKSYLEVCKDFVYFSARRNKSLDILCRPWAPDHPELPSWVAQLSSSAFRPGVNRADTRVRGDPLVGSPGGGQNIYNAAGTVSSRWSMGDKESKNLFITGFVLDTVGAKTLPAQQGNVPAEWTTFAAWKDMASLPPDPFWRTLVADRGPDGLIPPSYYQLACQHAFDQRTIGGDLVIGDLLRAGMPMIVSEFLERVQSVIFRRRLVRSAARNLLGLAPASAKKGDMICILFGLSVPVLLRLIKPEAGSLVQFRLIGECYVHGMMNGEALQHRDKSYRLENNDRSNDFVPGASSTFCIA